MNYGPSYTEEELDAWLDDCGPPVIHRKADTGNRSSPDNPFTRFAEAVGAGKAPLDVDQAFAEMIYLGPGGGGTAHDTLLRCSAALIARGEAPEAVIARALGELCQAAARSGTPFNPERERELIKQMVEGAVAKDFGRRRAEEAGDEKPENEIDPLADFRFDGTVPIEPEPTLIDGLLSTTGLTLIGGQSSAGKSFLAITMAVCLAEKKPFFGREVRERVGTLYIAGEGQGAIATRFAATKNAAGIVLERRLPVAWLDVPPSLESAPKITAFITKLRALDAKFRQEHGVRLGAVIIDTASACFDLKDENDNAEVTRICKIMQRVGAGFGGVAVPVHHYGKVLEAGPRGASAWRGHVEIILGALADIDPLTGAPSDRALVIAKSRDGIQGPVAPFTLEFIPLGVDKDGKEFGACVVKPELEGEVQFGGMKRRKASRSETALREAISGALNENGVNRTFRGRNVHAVSAEHVRLKFNRRYVVTEEDPLKAARAKRVAFNRALAQLPAEFGMGEFEGTQWIWRV